MSTEAAETDKHVQPPHTDADPYWFGDHPPPAIRMVTVDQSARWLARGWRDLWTAPAASLSYGAVFTLAAWLIFYALTRLGMDSLILPATAGFLLVGPLAAVGLYEVSRRHDHGQEVRLSHAFAVFARHSGQLLIVGLTLMLAFLTWVMVAMWIFAAFYTAAPPTLATFVTDTLSADQAPLFLLVGTLAGAVLAAGVFAITAFSLPLIIDRDDGPVYAMAVSVRAVSRNWRVMIGWAAMIVLVTGFGLLTFYIGLIVALPLVGHATWHAYKAVIGEAHPP
jgi:uncharacterized membrane protein